MIRYCPYFWNPLFSPFPSSFVFFFSLSFSFSFSFSLPSSPLPFLFPLFDTLRHHSHYHQIGGWTGIDPWLLDLLIRCQLVSMDKFIVFVACRSHMAYSLLKKDTRDWCMNLLPRRSTRVCYVVRLLWCVSNWRAETCIFLSLFPSFSIFSLDYIATQSEFNEGSDSGLKSKSKLEHLVSRPIMHVFTHAYTSTCFRYFSNENMIGYIFSGIALQSLNAPYLLIFIIVRGHRYLQSSFTWRHDQGSAFVFGVGRQGVLPSR